jgi:RNA polymerase sigma-70 factor, ECF subfamily
MSSADRLELRGGDEDSFRSLIEPHRPALHAHCCRMLGSPHDADDALQNTLLRAWRALPDFRGQSSLRTWLYRIATNVCLDAIARHPKPLPLAAWIEPYPDETLGSASGEAAPEAHYQRREALELAFIAATRHLPARQRTVLILRDALEFSAKEAADALATTVPSVNAALLRARRAVDEQLPEQSRHASLSALGDQRLRQTAERFADAFERGEIDAILETLVQDGSLAMRPRPDRRRGSDAIAA